VTRRQLSIFAAVVAEQGFSGAARSLHLTQPAVSLQVKELERACGLALLDRGVIVAEGTPREVLSSANVSSYYGANVRVVHDDEGVFVLPLRR